VCAGESVRINGGSAEKELRMFRQWLIIITVFSVDLAVRSFDVQAQEASTSPVSNAVGPQQIPFRMLQELAYGRDAQKQFRSEIPPKQIEAMKKV
jgi:hypothetical protein